MIRVMKNANGHDTVVLVADEYQQGREEADAQSLLNLLLTGLPAGTVDRLMVKYLQWEADAVGGLWRTPEERDAIKTVIGFIKARYNCTEQARQDVRDAQAGDEPS